MAVHYFLTIVAHEVRVVIKNREFSRVERFEYAIIKQEMFLNMLLDYVRERNKSEYDDKFFESIRHEPPYRRESWLV